MPSYGHHTDCPAGREPPEWRACAGSPPPRPYTEFIALVCPQARQEEARALIRELGSVYHPYELERGQAQSVEQVAARCAGIWTGYSGSPRRLSYPRGHASAWPRPNA